MEMRQLKYFIAVADELHFGRAAERLHLAQPALSIQIRNLETELGGLLFDRNKHRVSLTDAGRLFRDEAEKILAHAERAADVARLAFEGKMGRLDIGYTDVAALSGLLPYLLTEMVGRYPGIKISLHHLAPGAQITALMNGTIQAGLTATRALTLPDAIGTVQLAGWPLEVVLPAAHPLAAKTEILAEALREEPMVVYSVHTDDEYIAALAGRLLECRPKVAVKTNNPIMAAALVASGQGFTLIPKAMEVILTDFGAVFRPLAGRTYEMDCSLLFRVDNTLSVLDSLITLAEELKKKNFFTRDSIRRFFKAKGGAAPRPPKEGNTSGDTIEQA